MGLNIGVDLDGVCYDFGNAFRRFLVMKKGFDPLTLPTPTCWDFFREQWGISNDEYFKLYAEGVDAGIILWTGRPHPGCAEVISNLRKEGHKINIVTHRTVGKQAIPATVDWLQRNGIVYDTITFSADKTAVKNDLFIEDNIKNFIALEEAGVRSVLMDQAWNIEHETPYRVYDWDDFYDFVIDWEHSYDR